MNENPRISQTSSISVTDIQGALPPRRTPQIIQSAFFGILFSAAIFLTVLGTLYSLSANTLRAQLGYPILLFNLILILFLGFYLGLRVWNVLFASRTRRSAPLLHRRFVFIFSLAALTPAILVGAFSSSLISRNINDLFGENVRENMEQAREILDSYVAQEIGELIPEAQYARDVLNRNKDVFADRITYMAGAQRLARNRDLNSIYVMAKDGSILTRVESPNTPELKIPAPSAFNAIQTAGSIAFQTRDDIDYLIVMTKLDAYEDAYLYVGQFLRSNTGVLSSILGIEQAETTLDRYNNDQDLLQKSFLLTLIETALIILFAAIWLGFVLANRVIDPLGRLVGAAERVSAGDLSARVSVKGDWGEMSDLGRAFNRMTRQLGTQREDLIREHDISEQRRQFSEAVLSGVSAGVVGLTQEGRITLMNQSAERLLGKEAKDVMGHPIEKVLNEFAPAFLSARENVYGTAEDQVNFETEHGVRNVDLRVSAYEGARKDTGWVLTFDDMTRLVAAQRHSAWREVARRIAHEIKNPLTPIQLSAERLQRKYKKEIKSDPQTFENCTKTIIRQVESLEQMVDEFSSFARMPAPVLELINIKDILDQILFAQGVAFPEINFVFKDVTTGDVKTFCDHRLISQALTNIYKNAGESITHHTDSGILSRVNGEITTHLWVQDQDVVIGISDNGEGWPLPDKDRLLEPYVTTRESGTGLGLAIVKRIAEDHGGHLRLADRPDGQTGAYLQILLPLGKAPKIEKKLKKKNKKQDINS